MCLGSLALCLHTVVAGRAVAAHLGVVKVAAGFQAMAYGSWRTGRSTGCGCGLGRGAHRGWPMP